MMNGKNLTIILLVIMLGCSAKSSTTPSIFKAKVLEKSVTLADWKGATQSEKSYFSSEYTKLHLGVNDHKKAQDIIVFLDSSQDNLVKSMQQKKTPQEAIDHLLNGTNLYTLSKAGARLMGWPSPVVDFEIKEQ